jgi:DNA-binding Lrp family transcriptional regulator
LSTIHDTIRMDETDVKILGKLLLDARLSYRRVANEIGVSPPTVLARVKKLQNDSVIK